MTELEALEQKIAQLAALFQRAREENRDLRQRGMQLEADNQRLNDKVLAARERLEGLLSRLPADPAA
ncbi:MAG: DUF904 domain-containing protein [Burkholderiales bacterium]|nr:DUF904 domain-containing protein [Burkholderiales bacterium]